MKKILIFLCFTIIFSNAYAEVRLVPQSELLPSKTHQNTTKFITHVINSIHYQKKPIDDTLSSLMFDMYLKNLDPNRSFFLKDDIEYFSMQYRFALDQNLLNSNLDPAFNIFTLYRTRIKERSDYAITQLEKDFDFTNDEHYQFNRQELDWAKNTSELNGIWRRRVKNDMLNLLLNNKEIATAKETLKKRYKRIYTSAFQLDSNDVFQAFINAYTTVIEPHTNYLSPRVSENFDISMRLSLEGIGAVLRSKNDHTLIQKIIPGGPADLSKKLHSKDKIIGVGQGENGEIIDVIGWRLDDVVELIRGPKDTVLRLEIVPNKTNSGDLNQIITLIRNKIKLEESEAQSKIIDLPDLNQKIGIIEIPTFYVDFSAQARGDKNFKSTSKDVIKLLNALKQESITGIIIDLRSNGGGSLSEAIATTGVFIKSGPIVQTKNSSGSINISVDPDLSLIYSGPLAVLVDRNSASASEIFAGAIQDYQRGIIIGEPTYGKGTVQTIIDLNKLVKNNQTDHGKLKATIQKFFRISGGSTQNKGVIPDIIFPTAINIEKHGERALKNSLPWEEIFPADYKKLNAPIALYDQVRISHETRIKSNKAFQLLLEQLELIQKNNARNTISLKKEQRKTERTKALKSKHALDNAIRIAQGLEALPYQDTADQDQDQDQSENEDEDIHDILLHETANILGDINTLVQKNSK